MNVSEEMQVNGVIIRFTICMLLIISLIMSAFIKGERLAFVGPVIMVAFTLVILGLHLIYKWTINPDPDDPMFTHRGNYRDAIIWSLVFFCYLEGLALTQYLILPRVFPSFSVSPLVFQALVLVPLAVSATAYVLLALLREITIIRDSFFAWYHRDPKGARNSIYVFSAGFAFLAGIIVFLQANSIALRDGRIDWAQYYENFSCLLWVSIVISLIMIVYIFVILQKTDTA
ncbi:MAG: hypothetical protein CVV32_07795 [Methanomicrobiales archaeon HGW-Methanomicrobiales-3]|jgi:hypothetical protein|nr:MAG: hypothetical protein CVV32_07795 [Methanomicrobiales archaeon HGW-Methanomicrobiales-3]